MKVKDLLQIVDDEMEVLVCKRQEGFLCRVSKEKPNESVMDAEIKKLDLTFVYHDLRVWVE